MLKKCMGNVLVIDSVEKTFGAVKAVDNVSLSIHENEFMTLLGPSGCGKTSLLRLIAGFETCDAGKIILSGQDIAPLPACERPVNTVFQSYALFPHMTVAENIAFGMQMQNKPKKEIDKAVAEALELVRMPDKANRKPSQLSGGQQQRVALARALVNHPKILLLDESLSALDYKLRKDMQIELKRLQKDTGITFIFVTHDQDEALSMSDRIAVMEKGRVAQIGTPMDIYDSPATRFVADFIGICNFVKPAYLKQDGANDIGFRPEDVNFLKFDPITTGKILFDGQIAHINYRGPVTHYLVRLDNGELITVAEDEPMDLSVDERVTMTILPERLIRCG